MIHDFIFPTIADRSASSPPHHSQSGPCFDRLSTGSSAPSRIANAAQSSGSPRRGQHLLPPFIFLFLQIVDVAIYFNNQPRPVTVKVNDESLNDLLPPKVDSQFIPPQFFPHASRFSRRESFRGGVLSRIAHITITVWGKFTEKL